MGLIEKFEKEKVELAREKIKKRKVSAGLKYLIDDIKALQEKGLTKKQIWDFLNKALKVEIKLQSFYTFCNRHLKKPLTSPTTQKIKKSNSEGGKNAKVAQNGSKTPKTILDEVKSSGVEEDFDRNAGKTGFLDDI
jgi:hypothetical protein